MSGPLVIDGAEGEGGGQILRTALSLAAITGRTIRLENIRAKRPKPGLAAQHLTAVRAVAALCGALFFADLRQVWSDLDLRGLIGSTSEKAAVPALAESRRP